MKYTPVFSSLHRAAGEGRAGGLALYPGAATVAMATGGDLE